MKINKAIKINWKYFEWNTSSSEDAYLFSIGEMSFSEFRRCMLDHYQKEVRKEAKKFRYIGAKNLKLRAKKHFN